LQEPNADVHRSLSQGDLASAPISEPERALLGFVAKITQHAHRIVDADVVGLRAVGWTDPQIAECVYIAALFAFFNRVADAFGLDDPRYFDNPPPRGGDAISLDDP
jgi:alkylhydroperoxidase family enzyme